MLSLSFLHIFCLSGVKSFSTLTALVARVVLFDVCFHLPTLCRLYEPQLLATTMEF
jgi:hypothetical protein